MKYLLFALALLLVNVQAAAQASVQGSAINQQDPQQMILDLSTRVLDEITNRRVELETNPGEVRAFAEQHVLPFIDTERMARYVVGRYWREVSKEQQKEFVDQFTLTMMRSYSQSLLKLNITKIDVATALPDGEARVIIPTKVAQADGSVAEVSYRVFQEKNSQNWLVYDVVVEGISLLVNFRQTYTTDIERKGIDQVIVAMKERNKTFR